MDIKDDLKDLNPRGLEDCVNITIRKCGYNASKTAVPHKDPEAAKYFKRFGVIFHWGIYSIFAYNPPRAKSSKGLYNGSEWYWSRYKKPYTYGQKHEIITKSILMIKITMNS